ncbi:hypothetical protein PPYR_12396 [Photinus pyralis]|uniref:Coenzyme Q-binding protein COQ10 START domain-containing protein n=1 Tax=Photinus pyralis TaxID=7054 RepID=A0A1Y1JUF8_PHOPY|nr:coenzyme Q-binding protein COQ10 homolog B, mitochondrial [Photinus pyralis]KAB0795557.1 hypothetical protein PPYR_12396 [Photinus pyralis]
MHLCNVRKASEMCVTLSRRLDASDLLTMQKRSFLGYSKKKQYQGRKLVGYSPEQMYNVVTDVENYKYFLPFCKKSDVLSRSSSNLRAYLEIGFPPIVESYVSEVTLNRPNYTKAVCRDGKLFHYLVTYWKFSPGLRSNPYSSIVDFSVDFEFRSVLHSNLAHMFFDKLVQQMEGAFLVEAKRRYGQETLPSHVLSIPKS